MKKLISGLVVVSVLFLGCDKKTKEAPAAATPVVAPAAVTQAAPVEAAAPAAPAAEAPAATVAETPATPAPTEAPATK
ncbi:MAG: hypothetical protein PHQ93_03545 [Sulfurimonas sp.]|uniref:hypothetical protein n=1 Tax=Sulfurimonas sp. TaxID=2022749 RepID=UPI002638ACBC|nr:hypothetical protein [Sulfurimonas sp.]MDD5400247.1 hypothetical protein [Sulfurimonas sp.]